MDWTAARAAGRRRPSSTIGLLAVSDEPTFAELIAAIGERASADALFVRLQSKP